MKFKLFENSILEILFQPLRLFSKYDTLREPYIFEHVLSPVVLMTFLAWLPHWLLWIVWGVIVVMHVVVKELIVDRLKHGEFNWPNFYERILGCVYALVVFI